MNETALMDAPACSETSCAQTLPALHHEEELDAALEALLLVVDSPAGEDVLASALDQPVTRVVQALHRLRDGYADAGRGIDLRQVAQGWRLHTRDVYAPFVSDRIPPGISPAAVLGPFRNFQAKLLSAWGRAVLAGQPPG